MCGPVNIV